MKHSSRLTYERHAIRGRKVTMAFDAATGAAPSREEMLKGILEFLVGHLSDELYPVVEEELRRTVLGSTGTRQPAADRRRIAGDSAGEADFASRFPSSRRIGFA